VSDAEALVRAACSFDPRPAVARLATDPALSREDLACACVAGDAEHVARLLAGSREAARGRVGPFAWEPILYATFSRLPRADPSRARGIRRVVRALLDAGADPDAAFDHDGWLQVPLYGAAGILNDAEITRMLVDAGADPNDNGSREVGEALYHGCEFPDPACAALLIDAGTDPEVVDYCLGRALNFPYAEMAQMFCAHGAQASAGDLQQAVERRRAPATVAALLDAGAPVDARGDDGSTALQMATRWGEAGVAALLRGRGADAGAVSADDRALGAFVSGAVGTPPAAEVATLDAMLLMAVEGGHTATATRLLDAGAHVDGTPGGAEVPLGQAAWRRYPAIVSALVRRGARLQFDGGSAIGAALHGSGHCQHPEGGPTMQTVGEIPQAPYAEILRTLLDAGARVPERLWDGAPPPARWIEEILRESGA
jgi:ankyrin repeat protein